jgi:hypothetical protein
MAGFIRRFGYFPGADVLRQIEGVAIIDLPPPGSIAGVGTGVVGMVGEFADMRYCTTADGSGNITTYTLPQEVTTAADMVDKFGGWDETIGDFGVSNGNGFAAIRGKSYSRLILAPVNLCSAKGARFFRSLPMCVGSTNAAPVVQVQGASIAAGREFRVGAARIRIGTRVDFTAKTILADGTGGATTSGASAATQTFTGGSAWDAVVRADGSGIGAKKGDIIVIGYNNAGAVAPAGEAGTYRVATDPVAASSNLVVERLDGANFAWTLQSNVPWRLHSSSDADSALTVVRGTAGPGGYAAADVGGYTVPIRPLTDSTGSASGSTAYSAGTVLTPLTVPTALTGSTWDPLSGLGARTIVGSTTAFTAAIQAANVVSSATVDALYATAIDAFLSDQAPVSEVNIILSARSSDTIRSYLRQHVLTSSANGRGRRTIISPLLTTVSTATAFGNSAPGVGANRNERVDYAWPGYTTYIPEAVGYTIKTASGDYVQDGRLDMTADALLASVESVLRPELDVGQAVEPIPTVMASVLGLQRNAPTLTMAEYIRMKALGIVGLRIDRTSGAVFQSSVTTSLTSGQTDINRRRFADFVQDSMAERLNSYSKLPMTEPWKDSVISEITAFGTELLSPNNKAAARIEWYEIDEKSGNTAASLAQGIYVVITRWKMIPIARTIVLQTEVGQSLVRTSVVG